MSSADIIGLVASYVYASTLLALAVVIRRWRGYPQEVTRKIVHIGAGMWVFGVLGLFETWYIGIIPFATFIGLNYVFYRYRLFAAIDAQDSSPGTVYFALAITLLFVLFWRSASPADRSPIAVAGVMAMTWGDALAAIVGKRWGRHHYHVLGTTRSWEGSAAMFVATTIAIGLTLALLPGSALAPLAPTLPLGIVVAASLGSALVASAVEGVSPAGLDNLSVPLLASASVFAVVTALQ